MRFREIAFIMMPCFNLISVMKVHKCFVSALKSSVYHGKITNDGRLEYNPSCAGWNRYTRF